MKLSKWDLSTLRPRVTGALALSLRSLRFYTFNETATELDRRYNEQRGVLVVFTQTKTYSNYQMLKNLFETIVALEKQFIVTYNKLDSLQRKPKR